MQKKKIQAYIIVVLTRTVQEVTGRHVRPEISAGANINRTPMTYNK